LNVGWSKPKRRKTETSSAEKEGNQMAAKRKSKAKGKAKGKAKRKAKRRSKKKA
jgi:hypothetical protein